MPLPGRNIVEDALSAPPESGYCPACGGRLPRGASYCPDCGSEQTVPADEASVSRYWAYVLVTGLFAWVGILGVVATMADTAEMRFAIGAVALATTVALPLAGFFDLRYVRQTTHWRPDTFPWLVGFTVWVLNVVVLSVYLLKRYRLGRGE